MSGGLFSLWGKCRWNVDGMWMDRRMDRYGKVPNVGIMSSLILSLSGLMNRKSHGVVLC